MLNIKVAQAPGTVREVVLNDGATINDALITAGLTVQSGNTLQLDGNETDDFSQVLSNGQNIVIAVGAKGNS